MPTFFRGNTAATATSPADNLAYLIKSFIIVNKNGGATTISVSIVNSGTDFYISPVGLSLTTAGADGSIYSSDINILMKAGDQIKVSASAAVGYYFTMENVEP